MLQVAGTEYPGLFQIVHVIGIDLLQRGVALAFLITTIGRPVGICHFGNRCGRGGVGIQRAFHLLRIVKASPGQDPAADQQRHDQRGNGTAGAHEQATPDEGQDQPDTEEDQDIAARGQSPEVKTDLPDAPDHRGKQ